MSRAFEDLAFPNREPDHTLRSDLATTNGSQVAWLHLYLPLREREPVFFEVFGDTCALSLDDSFLWEKFDAAGPATLCGQGRIVIEIPRFAWIERSERPLAPGRSLTRLRGVAYELRLQHDYSYVTRDDEQNIADEGRVVTYTLSENLHLAPGTPWTYNFDGRRTFDQKHCIEISLGACETQTFDTHYSWFDDANNGSYSARLVAIHRTQTNAALPIGIDLRVADAVLLLSFLTATRTVISRVSTWDGDKQYEYFQPRFGFPDDARTGPFRSGLVTLNRLEQCFAIAWTQWQCSPNVAYLRNAIYALLPGTNVARQLSFQRCYGALEGLVKAYSPPVVNRDPATSSSPISANLRRLRSRIANDEDAEVIDSLDAAISRFSEPTFRDRFYVFRSHWKIPALFRFQWNLTSAEGLERFQYDSL